MSEEVLSAASIADNLGTSLIGKKVLYYPRLASTMDTARKEARLGAAEGTVILTGEQTQGRGRRQRAWLSPRGNIALSVILYPDASLLPYLIMMASLAVVRSIESVTGLKPQIKWPNDVLIRRKKVCGILIENELRRNHAATAIIGIGINTGLTASAFAEIADTATSLEGELGREVSRRDIIRDLVVEMDRLYLALPANSEAIFAAWKDKLATIGQKVYVESAGNRLEGIAESVDRDGFLVLRQADGTATRIVAGDVTLRDK